MRELSPIPQIELEKIDPQSKLSEEEKLRKKELREKEKILKKDTPEQKPFERLSRRISERFAGTCHGHSERSTRSETDHAEGIYTKEELEKQELWKNGESAIRHWGEDRKEDGDMQKIEDYKTDRLASGPGSRSIRELVKIFKKMDKYGIDKDRIVNSSLENLISFLVDERGKTTENLMNIKAGLKNKE